MFKNLRISQRLTLGFGILIALFIITNLLAMRLSASIMGDLNNLVDDRMVKVNAANDVKANTLSNGRSLRGLLLVETAGEREQLKNEIAENRKQNSEMLQKLKALLVTDDAKQAMAKIEERRAPLQDLYTRLYAAVDSNPAEAKRILFKEFTPANNAFIEALHEMVELQERHMHASVEENRASYERSRAFSIILLVIGIAIAVGAALWIIRSISAPLSEMSEVITSVRDHNDFTRTISVTSGDEVGQTAQAFASLLTTLRQTLAQLKESIGQVASASEGLVEASGQSAQASSSTSESAASMAASVEQMSVSINQVSENARSASELAHQAGRLSEEGGSVIEATVSEMQRIAATIDRVAEALTKLGERSDQISGIVQVIKDVADQTNLLALNAAIEAARAGETGRGFAVVADEVRKLAERTTQATGEISEMIANVQESSHSAVAAMHETLGQVRSGRELAERAGGSIVAIKQAANDVIDVVSGIADAIAEQSAASQSIAQQLEHVAQAAEENNATSEETASSAHNLGKLAVDMRTTTERFKI